MLIERIRSEFKRRVNKFDSNHAKDYPDAFIDDLFNIKQLEFIDAIVEPTPTKATKFGIEANTLSIDLISNIIKENIFISPYKVYQDKVEFLLPSDYYHILNLKVDTDCGLFLNTKYVKQGSLNAYLTDDNTKPSKKWKRTIFNIAQSKDKTLDSSLYVYKENFKVNGIYISYIQEPIKVFSGGYDSLEYITGNTSAYSSNTKKVDSPLTDSTCTYIIDSMVNETFQNLENQIGFGLIQPKINKNI